MVPRHPADEQSRSPPRTGPGRPLGRADRSWRPRHHLEVHRPVPAGQRPVATSPGLSPAGLRTPAQA